MKIVLLSGGSGKRLWPLSNDIRSKQFLKVVRNEEGKKESMLQRVYRQIKGASLNEGITVATSAAQEESIRGQLGEEVSLVVEPERRNTFPAIALSAAYLYFEKSCPPDETIVVLPVDPYVGEEYFQMLQHLDWTVQTGMADIVLMGVKPTYPSEKYGYIIPAAGHNMGEKETVPIFPVLEFKEKPNLIAAQEFINRGGLWNCGVFAFKLSYLMDIVQRDMICRCYADVVAQYGKLERTSFDYAVVEKARSVAVVSYNGEWKDLGTWNTLTEVMEEEPIGDVSVSKDCRNTHVINELEIPVVVMGAKDMVVAASPDGILVSDKVQSSYIKKYVENRNLRPMFEERSWGEYTVLNLSVDADGNRAVTKKKFIQAGKEIGEARHQHHLEVWTVLSGRAVISIKGRKHDALAGDTFTIERGVLHSLRAEEDTVLLEVQIEEAED
ncbi:MAG: cupin domain-containing protein [Lachnospiraceae bacterium]|nr:cupin domain-containing protein [Lachnospiraceae bacterium]